MGEESERIIKVETIQAEHGKKIDKIENRINTIENKQVEFSVQVAGLHSTLSNVVSNVAILTNTIEKLTESVSDLKVNDTLTSRKNGMFDSVKAQVIAGVVLVIITLVLGYAVGQNSVLSNNNSTQLEQKK